MTSLGKPGPSREEREKADRIREWNQRLQHELHSGRRAYYPTQGRDFGWLGQLFTTLFLFCLIYFASVGAKSTIHWLAPQLGKEAVEAAAAGLFFDVVGYLALSAITYAVLEKRVMPFWTLLLVMLSMGAIVFPYIFHSVLHWSLAVSFWASFACGLAIFGLLVLVVVCRHR